MNISEQKDMEKLLTALKSHTSISVYNNERYKIPVFISNQDYDYKEPNSKITAVQKFHYNDKWYSYKYSIDEPQYAIGILKVTNMPYNSFQNKRNKKSFVCTMHDLLYQRYCEPFMIFIDGKFVNWNYISIVFDCNDTYIILHGEKYNWYNIMHANINMVILPFKVDYIGEESNIHFDMMYDMFRSYIQDSLSSNNSIIVPGIDEVYEYKGMIYNVGAWVYTQLKYEYLGLLSDYKINKLKNIIIIKKEYDSAGNIINTLNIKYNAIDRDSYNIKMYNNICCYTQDIYKNKSVFRFNSDGAIDDNGINIISVFDPDIRIEKIESSITNCIGSNINNQFYKQNYFIFKNNYFYPNCDSEIYYNLLFNNEFSNSDNYSYYIFYYLPIEIINNHANNHFYKNFLKNNLSSYLKSGNDDKISYIKDCINPLSFNYNNNDSYETNKNNIIESIIKYDPTLLNPLFKTNIESIVLTGKQINSSLSSPLGTFNKNGMKISRSKYGNHESYIMIFKNGELLEDYSKMIVYSNFFYIPLDTSLNDNDQIEILYFNNINNNELEFKFSNDMIIENGKKIKFSKPYYDLEETLALIAKNENIGILKTSPVINSIANSTTVLDNFKLLDAYKEEDNISTSENIEDLKNDVIAIIDDTNIPNSFGTKTYIYNDYNAYDGLNVHNESYEEYIQSSTDMPNTEVQYYAMEVNYKPYSKFINSDELKIFCDYPENIIKYNTLVKQSDKISFNVSMRDKNNVLYMYPFIDNDTKLTAVSSRKFIYQRIYVDQKAYRIELDKRFKYCDNQKQYVLFINGRRMNDESFLITIPKYSRPFWGKYLYVAKFVNPDDRIEIFYVPDELIDINVDHSSLLNYNGYIETDKTTIDVPYDPRLYLLFINGKKIASTDIIQVDSSTFRISKDQQSTNNLMINPINSNSILEVKEYMNGESLSEYDSIIQFIKNNDDLSINELNKIFNTFVTMSDTETDKTKQNVGKIAILNEIIRDFWIASGYPYNEKTFVYDYEILFNDMNIVDEQYRFVDLPAMDATQFINIIKNELLLLYFYIYNRDTKLDDLYVEKGSVLTNLHFQWMFVQNIYGGPEIKKQTFSYTVNQFSTVNIGLTPNDRIWRYSNIITSDISFKFKALSTSQEVQKKFDIKFVNGIFYGNLHENMLKYIKDEYDWIDYLMMLVPKNGIMDTYNNQEQENQKYTASNYANNNIIISDLPFTDIDNNNSTTIESSSTVNEYTIESVLSLMNKKLQDTPELVLNDYIIGNNNYFIYACPTRLACKDNQINIEFIMPDPHSDDIKQHCRDNKATPIYTNGSWDNIINHNLFEPIEKMEMIYLGEYMYTNSNGFSELYSIWRSNGYFTRLFDNYKFNIIVRFKDGSTDTIDFVNN